MKTNKLRILFVLWMVSMLLPIVAGAQNQKPVISDPDAEIASRTDSYIKLVLPAATDDNTSWDKLEYTVMWLNADEEGAEMQWRTQKGIRTFEIYGLQPGANYYYYCSVRDEAGLVNHYNMFWLRTPAKRYGIKVKGVEIDADNRNDVLNDGGSVSYDPYKGALYFNHATIECADLAVVVSVPVEIVYNGDNTITSTNAIALWTEKDVVIHQKDYLLQGTISFSGKTQAARCEGNLTVRQGEVSMRSGGDIGVYMYGTKLNLMGCEFSVDVATKNGKPVYNCGSFESSGCAISAVSNAKYVDLAYDQKTKSFLDANGSAYNNMRSFQVDFESYLVYFCGQEVTSLNFFDITNDGGSVAYDKTTRTFTLNNAKAEVAEGKRNVFSDKLAGDNLSFTFKLIGDNELLSEKDGIIAPNRRIVFTGTGSLYVESEAKTLQAGSDVVVEGGCRLTLNGEESVFDARGLHVDNSSLTLRQGNKYPAMAVVSNCRSFGLTNAHFETRHHYDAGRFAIVDANDEFARGEIRIVSDSAPGPTNKCDVNHDGSVNVTDVVSIYNFVALGSQSGIQKDRADVDGNGDVNVTDVVAVYNYIMLGK